MSLCVFLNQLGFALAPSLVVYLNLSLWGGGVQARIQDPFWGGRWHPLPTYPPPLDNSGSSSSGAKNPIKFPLTQKAAITEKIDVKFATFPHFKVKIDEHSEWGRKQGKNGRAKRAAKNFRTWVLKTHYLELILTIFGLGLLVARSLGGRGRAPSPPPPRSAPGGVCPRLDSRRTAFQRGQGNRSKIYILFYGTTGSSNRPVDRSSEKNIAKVSSFFSINYRKRIIISTDALYYYSIVTGIRSLFEAMKLKKREVFQYRFSKPLSWKAHLSLVVN